MTKHLVVVAGNIGVGKTSLTERIGARLGWWTGFESVADNPYLADFYSDMRAWAFHLQIFFLGHRAEQYLEAAESEQILDRSIMRLSYLALFFTGLWAGATILPIAVYLMVVNSTPRPNLLIYLKAPVHVLMERIRRRSRNMETGITTDYLTLLDSFYEEWLGGFDLCPVLTIRTDDLDYVHQQKHLDTVIERIQDKLAGKELMEF
jgi:deoxyadenosine/deoxycytidine kinase